MKNKNAFTLVELLGVIVVLTILALITIPIISNVINDVRIKALQNSAYGLVEASNLYYVQKEVNSNIRFDKNDSKDTLKELSYKGVVKEGTVIIDKIGQVTVCITDGKNSAYKNYNESKVTTIKGSLCKINEGSSIVYLDDEATITELSLSELTQEIQNLKEVISSLATKNELNSLNNNLSNQISDARNFQITLDDVYPVGSVYITTTEDTVAKVQTKFGGTWQVFGSGRTLVGVNTSDSDFNTVEKESGEKNHILIGNELPVTNGSFIISDAVARLNTTADLVSGATGIVSFNDRYSNGTVPSGSTTFATNPGTKKAVVNISFGNNQPHNNLQPYITVYMYKRTA